MEPTYSTKEIIERLDNCTSIAELRGYGQVIDEEKRRYSLKDLDEIYFAYTCKAAEFSIYLMLRDDET